MKYSVSSAHKIINFLEIIGLLIVAISTVIAVYFEIMHMISTKQVALADLLLLFIYLEVLAMVGIYLDSGQLPVRMPLYIAMVALARYLILDMKAMDNWRIIAVSAGILLISASVLAHRFGKFRYPYPKSDKNVL